MTEPTVDEMWEVLRPFFENPRDAEPDVKALARLLRSNAPLPKGLRSTLAEMLDSHRPGELACNWQLRPKYIGCRDEEILRERKEKQVKKAMERAANVSQAMAEVTGISERTAYSVRKEMKRRRAQLEELLSDSGLTDEQKARVRRAWDS
jgi:hypothetical protein